MMMRKALTACLIALCLPLVAHADDVVLTSGGGTFTSNTVGQGTVGQTTLTLSGSYLARISGLSDLGISNQSLTFPGCGACLGSVTLTTGTLTSGALNQSGYGYTSLATFGTGGTFAATGPAGMVFQGTFSSATWSKPSADKFALQGTIVNATLTIGGVTYNIGGPVRFDLTTNGSGEITDANGAVSFLSGRGSTNFLAPVPEPGTLALLGTGLIAVGFIVRRVATYSPLGQLHKSEGLGNN